MSELCNSLTCLASCFNCIGLVLAMFIGTIAALIGKAMPIGAISILAIAMVAT